MGVFIHHFLDGNMYAGPAKTWQENFQVHLACLAKGQAVSDVKLEIPASVIFKGCRKDLIGIIDKVSRDANGLLVVTEYKTHVNFFKGKATSTDVKQVLMYIKMLRYLVRARFKVSSVAEIIHLDQKATHRAIVLKRDKVLGRIEYIDEKRWKTLW